MALRVVHPYVNPLPDAPPEEGEFARPSDWNAEHVVEGAGSAAEANVEDFATAAQGAKADSAVQPGDLGTAAAADVGDFATAAQGLLADSAVQPGDIGTAAAKNVGTAGGNVPELDGSGKLDTAVLPAVAITDTFVVNSQASMLALVAEKGDVAIRTDLNKSFILQTNSPTTLADWKELLTPTDAVLSVAGLTGAVSASALRGAINVEDGADVTDPTNVAAAGAVMASLLTTRGDIIRRGASAPERYALGTAGYALKSDGTDPVWAPAREVLTANRTYYVRADGSDSNNGLADSSGGGLLTPQKAFDTACTIDLNGFTVTISIGSGSFEGITFNKAWVGGNITIVGAGAANTTIASTNGIAAFYVSAPAPGVIRIDNMKITNSVGGGVRLDASSRFLCGAGLEFGTCVASHVLAAAPGSFLSMIANYTISGGSIYHLNAQFLGYIRATGITVTLTGTPAFSIAYANASNMGAMLCSGSFSGSATGPRYAALQGGGINTGGAGANFFPGNSSGTATSPGWYL